MCNARRNRYRYTLYDANIAALLGVRLSNPKSMSPAAMCLSSDRVSPLPDNILEDPPQRRLNSHCLCGFAAIRSPTEDKCNSGVYCIYKWHYIYYIMHVCLFYSIQWPPHAYVYLVHRNVHIIISDFFFLF